jgi:DNA-binding NarL/FixJ family response regulator
VSSPALRGAATPLPFTEREREIAMLVAAGLTNQAIATRLTVSVRTVEGHIYRACGKVGVNDRAALAALLRDGSER